MRSPIATFTFICAFILPALGAFFKAPTPPAITHDGVATIGNATFAQYVSHMNHSLGTFSQRYWYSTEFWRGPGSPIVLFTPGELAADGYTGYLSNRTITGLFAEAIGGAVVMVEHRYWGESSPYDIISTKNLQYLTLKESILDLIHFSKTVSFPFDENSSNSDKAVGFSLVRLNYAYIKYLALGILWRLLLWRSSCLDRIGRARRVLGLSCFQCAS